MSSSGFCKAIIALVCLTTLGVGYIVPPSVVDGDRGWWAGSYSDCARVKLDEEGEYPGEGNPGEGRRCEAGLEGEGGG